MQVSPQLLRTLRYGYNHFSKERALLKIEGVDSLKFLQGLTTNDIKVLASPPKYGCSALYTALLNPQGRVLHDVIISTTDQPAPPPSLSTPSTTPLSSSFLIDCSTNSKEDIQKHFMQYKVRNKFNITNISDTHSVWAVYGKSLNLQQHENNDTNSDSIVELIKCMNNNPNIERWFVDPRFHKLGIRLVLPSDAKRKLSCTS